MFTFAAAMALLQTVSTQTPPTVQDAVPPPAPPVPPACTSEAHAQFDFWVGTWEVYPNGRDTKIADSRIERINNGCAVIENWMPFNGRSGTSLNNFDPANGTWHQKWVGSAPGAVEFTGGANDGGMVLTGNWATPSAPHQLVRMTYSVTDEGHVRQHGEASTDHGVSWQTSFDLIYRRKDTPQP